MSNNATICSVPAFCEETPADRVDVEAVRVACAHLPRSTEMPTAVGFCIYLRNQALDLVGALDPAFAPGYNEENDWVMRAQAMGFIAKRANRAFVYHLGSRSFRAQAIALEERNALLLAERHPHYRPQVERFLFALDGRLAAHAVRVESTGTIRVALDLRHLPLQPVGTARYAIALARGLAKLPEVELTLVVRHPSQAKGIPGRLVSEENGLVDVEVIHKPCQVFDPADLQLLFGSPAHAVITHQDLIAHRVGAVFPHQEAADRYRTTSALALQAAQATIAISDDARSELIAEFGLPPEEVAVVPHAVEHEWFAESGEFDRRRFRDLVPPGRFFLSVATDFPHKNLRNLIEAHALLRRRWSSLGEPPRLVLVGSQADIRDGIYRHLTAKPPAGVIYLGAVTDDQLRALYHAAVALVFPSVYEGFGLPILEAMAAGTPVLAMPISSVPEVGGDGVLYPDGLSIADLARAIERLATDEALR
ncbi:MAG: glycosyltransferase, partial [Mycobacterium sp.]